MPNIQAFHEDDHRRQRRRGRAIPPVWPLASSVAVNPYLGQTGETLAETGARLGRVSGVPVTMPRAVYRARIEDGTITDQDISTPSRPAPMRRGLDLDAVKTMARAERCTAPKPQPTDRAIWPPTASGIDWPGIIADRFGHWAAGYFDQGQALWAAPPRRGAYDAWRQYATHDLTPEIAGLKGFAQFVSETPDTADEARQAMARWACRRRRWRPTSTSCCSGWAAGRRWAAITCGRRNLRADG
jgi:hypothetical protein